MELELHYNAFKDSLEKYKSDPATVLLLLANYLFEMYPELYRQDILRKGIDVVELNLPENYSELKEVYAFHKDSYVFTALNAAHDLLLVSEQLRK